MGEPLARPEPAQPCLCGSGVPFGKCCGTPGRTAPPKGILVRPGFLPPALCARLVDYASSAPREPMQQETSSGRTVSPQRVGEHVNIAGIRDGLVQLMRDAFGRFAGRFGHRELSWLEPPVFLAYGPGGRYINHADSDAWSADEARWRKVVDRDLSLLIYLDQDYQGGCLSFPRFGYRLAPATGMLVMFPSDARYAHCAEPVTRGRRHVLACWAAARGVERVLPRPPADRIEIGSP